MTRLLNHGASVPLRERGGERRERSKERGGERRREEERGERGERGLAWHLFLSFLSPSPLYVLHFRTGPFTTNQKFMTRLLLKHGASVPLMVLVGHECFMNGSFRLALGEYFMAYNEMTHIFVHYLLIVL